MEVGAPVILCNTSQVGPQRMAAGVLLPTVPTARLVCSSSASRARGLRGSDLARPRNEWWGIVGNCEVEYIIIYLQA